VVKDGELVAIFHSIHRVMKAEKLLKDAGEKVLLIPVPRQLTSDCGLALRFSFDAKADVVAILAGANLRIQELYQREGKGFTAVEV